MTDTLQTFSNTEFGNIRTLTIDFEPWFVGKDIADALGYERTDNALRRHVDDEDKLMHQISASGQNRNMIIINESGLYSLILSSKLPNAKKFKRWVTSEVLPAIRKTGSYSIEPLQPIERITTKDDYLRAASIVGSCRNERLPYVLSILAKVGLDVVQPGDIESGECTRLINTAINEYGLSMTAIGKLTGLHTTQIQRIRTGASKPSAERSQLICTAIRSALPEIE
jgi:prophage antirepressor-like protein|nr:MAG TPA: repressor domain protein [Caudoviricetes sp.]